MAVFCSFYKACHDKQKINANLLEFPHIHIMRVPQVGTVPFHSEEEAATYLGTRNMVILFSIFFCSYYYADLMIQRHCRIVP